MWEEVLAATPGQQKQMKMKYFLFKKIRFISLGTALHASQNRSEFSHRSRKPQKALLSVSYHIPSSCQVVSYLHTCVQQERGRTHSCSTEKKQLGKANSLCKASSLQQHKPRNRIGHIKSKSKIAPSSDHLHFR